MSSHESERVLVLLRELSMWKELDEAGSKTKPEPDAQRFQDRHQEIVEEIKAMAEQKKTGSEENEGKQRWMEAGLPG